METARRGGGQVTVLLGEAGIGKTRLLEELAAAVPLGGRRSQRRPARRGRGAGSEMHWADEMSLRLLSFLGRRSPAWPVLIVNTVREEELETAPVLARVLDELEAEGHLLKVTLSPLSRAETLTLVRALMRAGHDVDAVARVGEHVTGIAPAGQTRGWFLVVLGEAHRLAGNLAPTRQRAGQGLAILEKARFHEGTALAHRTLGRIAQAEGAAKRAPAGRPAPQGGLPAVRRRGRAALRRSRRGPGPPARHPRHFLHAFFTVEVTRRSRLPRRSGTWRRGGEAMSRDFVSFGLSSGLGGPQRPAVGPPLPLGRIRPGSP